MEKKHSTSRYILKALKNQIKSRNVYLVIFLIEFIQIFIANLNSVNGFISQTYKFQADSNIFHYLNKIYLLEYTNMLDECNGNKKYLCDFSSVYFLIISLAILFYFIFTTIIKILNNGTFKNLKKISCLFSKKYFITNYYFIHTIVHILGIPLISIFMNAYMIKISILIDLSFIFSDFILAIFSLFMFIILLYSSVLHINSKKIFLFKNYNYFLETDNFISIKIDYFILFMKILISISQNIMNKNISQFLNFFIFSSTIIFTLYIYYEFLVNKKSILMNTFLNLFKVCLILFTTLIIIFNMLLIFLNGSMYQYIFTILICIILTLYFSFLTKLKIEENIFNSDNSIHQLLYVISQEAVSSDKRNLNLKISIILFNHKLKCQEENNSDSEERICKLCKLYYKINKEQSDFSEFFEIFSKKIKNSNNLIVDKNYDKFDMNLFIIAEIEYQMYMKNDKIIKIMYKLKKEIYRSKNKNFTLNLLLLSSILQKKCEFKFQKNQYTIIEKYEESNILLKKSISLILNLLNVDSYNLNTDVYSTSEELHTHSIIVKKNLDFVKTKRETYVDNYKLFLMEYVFQEAFNKKSENIQLLENIETIKQDLSINFHQNNQLIISLDLKKLNLQIKGINKKLNKFKNAPLDSIFPEELREYGKQEFLKCLKKGSGRNKINFNFIALNEENNIRNFNLTGTFIPGFKNDIILLNSVIEYSNEELIVFEKFEKIFEYERLILSTKLISNYLKISNLKSNIPNNKNGYYLCLKFEEIFEQIKNIPVLKDKKNYRDNIANPIEEINDVYVLDYQKYYNSLCEKARNFEDNEIYIILEEIKKEINKKVYFRITLKNHIATHKKSFFIYEINLLKKNKFIPAISDTPILNEINSEEESYKNILETCGSSNSSVSSVYNGNQLYLERKNNQKLEKSESNGIKKFTLILIIFNFCTIITCIIFLFIGVNEINNLKLFFDFRMNFIDIRISFYSTMMNLFLISSIQNNSLIDNSDAAYFKKFNKNAKIKFNILQYNIDVLTYKLDLLKTSITNLREFVYNSEVSDIKQYFNDTSSWLVSNKIGKDLTLTEIPSDYFEKLNLFINSIKVILDYSNTNSVPIYIVNFRYNQIVTYGSTNLFYQNLNFTQDQLKYYDVLFNFENFYNETEDLINQVELLFNSDYLYSIKSTVSMFFIILILIHLVLILICIALIVSQITTIDNFNNLIQSTFSSANSKSELMNKLEILKKINEFYEENPKNLMSKLNSSKKKNFQMQSSAKISSNIIEKKIVQNSTQSSTNIKINKSLLVSQLIKNIIKIFIFYYSYEICCFFIFESKHSNLVLASDYARVNSKVQTNLINNVLLVQSGAICNQTDDYFTQLFKNSVIGDRTFFETKRNNYFIFYNQLKVYQEQSMFSYLKDIDETVMNCSSIYRNLNDPIFSHFIQVYNNNTIIPSFENICNTLSASNHNQYTNILEEIEFSSSKIISGLSNANGDAEKLKQLNDSDLLNDIYMLFLFMMRPIQSYINNLVIASVKLSINEFITFCIIFLIFNICVDLIIFAFILKKMINKILNDNTNMKELIQCLKI
jgi:hypothetical protein